MEPPKSATESYINTGKFVVDDILWFFQELHM